MFDLNTVFLFSRRVMQHGIAFNTPEQDRDDLIEKVDRDFGKLAEGMGYLVARKTEMPLPTDFEEEAHACFRAAYVLTRTAGTFLQVGNLATLTVSFVKLAKALGYEIEPSDDVAQGSVEGLEAAE